MKPGPKPSTVEKVGYKVYIPTTLMADIRLLLLDPFHNQIKHGALTQLVEGLLNSWVQRQKGRAVDQFSMTPDQARQRLARYIQPDGGLLSVSSPRLRWTPEGKILAVDGFILLEEMEAAVIYIKSFK